jgi:hypothetical protein
MNEIIHLNFEICAQWQIMNNSVIHLAQAINYALHFYEYNLKSYIVQLY